MITNGTSRYLAVLAIVFVFLTAAIYPANARPILERQSPLVTLSSAQVVGLTVSVDGSAEPGNPDEPLRIIRISWDWGDGAKQDASFPATHTYSTPGAYLITVTVFQSNGRSSRTSEEVAVVGPVPPVETWVGSEYNDTGTVPPCDTEC